MANFADIQHEPLNTTVSLEAGDNHHSHGPIPSTTKNKKKREHSVLRKAPQAPKRFKSSYIMFFMAKQDEIKAELGPGAAVSFFCIVSDEPSFTYCRIRTGNGVFR